MTGRRYRFLVFDWDGTLIDSEAKIIAILEAVIEELDLDPVPHECIRNVIGLALPGAIAELFPGYSQEIIGYIVQRYRYRFSHPQSPVSSLFPGTMATLEQLHWAGYSLCVATSKSRRGLEQELDATDLRRYFSVTRCADETRSKPDPLMLNEIMGELGANPEETVVIGDSEYDLGMAKNARTDAVAVTSGVHPRERLLAWFPRACLDSIVHLPRWLDGLGQSSGKA